MKKLIVLFIAFFIGINGNAFSQPATGLFPMQYTDRGVVSQISFAVPEDYDSTKSYPFLLGWHGSGDSGNNMRNILYQLLSSRVGAILVCPDVNNVLSLESSYFNNLINASLDYTFNTYNIDAKKVIAIGFSMGGGISYQLGLLNPEIFTGIIGHAPAIGSGQFNQTMWDNITKIRMATILGTLDFNWTAVNALMLEIQNRGGELLYLVKPGVGHVDNNYFNSQEIYDDYMQCYKFVIGEVTGVKNLQNMSYDLLITPNPATDYIYINSKCPSGEYHIIISDMQGNSVFESKNFTINNDSPIKLDVNNLSDGLYFLRLYAKEKIFTAKFIVLK
ncbi:MAG: T9SS type A sorting domain-containing protein [bacterium]